MPLNVGIGGFLLNLVRLGYRCMSPNIEFGPPVHRSPPDSSGISWWHIPATVSRSRYLRRLEEADCQIWLIRHWTDQGDAPPGEGIALKWKSRDGDPTSRATLRNGETVLVPVALRREGSDGYAVLTNDNWFREDSTKSKRQLGPGTYEFDLEVRRGHVKWLSRHRYVLKVPEPAISNGQFILEMRWPR